MKAGRVGDEAKCPEDGHSCPSCKHVTVGPSKKGSPDVYINNQSVLRVGDPGEHSETCCGDNTWRAKTGSSTVTVNGLPIHRVGDETEHCGGVGKLITGSSDVDIGSGGSGAQQKDQKSGLNIDVKDAFGRSLADVTARILSPDGVKEVKFNGTTNLNDMHRGSTVIIEKGLQESQADGGAVKGIVPDGTRMVTPIKKQEAPPAAAPAQSAAPAAKASPPPAAASQASPPPAAPAASAPPAAPAPAPAPAASPPPAAAAQASPPAASPAAAENVHNADVPAANGTSNDPGLATVHRPQDGTVNVTQFTVHNWVQAVYKAFNIPFPTGVWETAMLGVREASMLAKGLQGEDAVVKSEELAAAGKTSATGGNGTAKMANTEREATIKKNVNTNFDDALYIVWTESTVEKNQKVEVFQCTVDPSVDVSTGHRGHPFLLEGYEYQCIRTNHHASKYPNPYKGNDAYQVRDKGPKETIHIVRSHGKRIVGGKGDVDSKMVRSETGVGINVHFRGAGADAVGNDVSGWSAGCTVLRHGLRSKRYARFVTIINTSKNSPRPYVIVSSQYVKLYHEWVDFCKGDPKVAQDVKSVLKEDALKERELNGKYIPSIIDIKFAKANPAFVDPALFTTAK